ncbi:uncharacterized protein N7459_008341 [Penicillium hispanicum]|uniref:uncharacterized protein n=1 Tax=Penicillium hispanicum TaxID=1080232 RepID=UPI002541339D|nr:uncharacterized protein N7459_008341 [Penicillium hispanicum]KAJ5573914.1 hypothetical protein N7459_008341 [Penicillium hispanicum]
MTPHATANHPVKPSQFLQLPTELRLKIYDYAFSVPNDYLDKPLIVVHDRGNVFTARGRYRALSMCPSWVGEDGTARNLLAVNRQIHDEAEDHLYAQHTLFFRHSVDLDRLGDFLDTLSATARRRIHSVGFEVFFFVHTQTGVPKRTLKQYERARDLLRQKLPHWESVLFYLDPRFYYPSACVGGRELAARGVRDLAARFGSSCAHVTFYPRPDSHRRLVEEAQQLLWRSSSPEGRAVGGGRRLAKAPLEEMGSGGRDSAGWASGKSCALDTHRPMAPLSW